MCGSVVSMKLEINKMEIDGNEANGIASNWSDEFLREIKNEDDSKQNEDSEGFTDVHPSYIPLCPIKNEGERCFVKKDTKSSDNRDDDDDGSADCGGSADDDNNGGDDERKDGNDAYGGSTDCGSSDDDNCNRNRDYRSRNLSGKAKRMLDVLLPILLLSSICLLRTVKRCVIHIANSILL